MRPSIHPTTTTTGQDGTKGNLLRASSLESAEIGRDRSSPSNNRQCHNRRGQKLLNETTIENGDDHQRQNNGLSSSSEKYRKRKSTRKGFSGAFSFRRFLLELRTRPQNAVITLIAIFLGICLVVSLAVTAVAYSKIGASGSQGSQTNRIGVPQIHVLSHEVQFPTGHYIGKNGNVIRSPDALGPAEKEESFYVDYGELIIDIFEEEGSARNIRHDFWLFETEYRFPDAEQDDDIEL